MVKFLLESGIQTFCVSWRNPTAKERDWRLETYVAALDAAVDVVREITGSVDVSMMGACSGGITSAAYFATLGSAKIKNLTLAVCLLDMGTADDSAFGVGHMGLTTPLASLIGALVALGAGLAVSLVWPQGSKAEQSYREEMRDPGGEAIYDRAQRAAAAAASVAVAGATGE